ncbi:MAG: alpha/beta fold hydrolase [Candidatus Cohnella colombiensis]|uniref:Alpha/beta fold hydrolase n=1 Tax=Candidatus Cohnella colombiensis TaxID=3121368 RepID=A0AA95JEE5_9BACL|nr:MAG: alpha/beta fold hydrolase [Cohnella sp.]
MRVISKQVMNNGIQIHYLDTETDSGLIPLLICPGLSETADEYRSMMNYFYPRRCVVLSFRGRGQSDTPQSGYGLAEHVSDLASVIEATDMNRFHLYAHSRGVSYALGYAIANRSRVYSLILQDYPAMHKQMPEGWAKQYMQQYLVPFSRQRNIRPEAVRGIERDSETVNFNDDLGKRVLVLRGMREDSLLSDQDIEQYRRICPELQVAQFLQSGHDIRHTEEQRLYQIINQYISHQ